MDNSNDLDKQPASDKLGKKPDKKTAPQSSNTVWYLLGLGVMLLLLATLWNGQDQERIDWSVLEQLIAVSNAENTEGPDYIEIESEENGKPCLLRFSGPTEIVVNMTEVTGKVNRRKAPLMDGKASSSRDIGSSQDTEATQEAEPSQGQETAALTSIASAMFSAPEQMRFKTEWR